MLLHKRWAPAGKELERSKGICGRRTQPLGEPVHVQPRIVSVVAADRRANGGVKRCRLTVHRRTPIESWLKMSERRRLKTGARRTRCRSRSRRRARCSGSRSVPQTWFRNRYNDTRRSAYGNLDSSLHSLMMGPEMGSFCRFNLPTASYLDAAEGDPKFILTEESKLNLHASTEAAENTRRCRP